MALIKNSILISIGLVSFVCTFVAFGQLTFFLSAPIKLQGPSKTFNTLYGNKLIFNALFVDASLAVAFILLHSFLRVDSVKGLWSKVGLGTATRSIYNLISGAVLLMVIKYWRPVPITFWEVNLETQLCYWLFTGLHSICWTVIYGGSLLMDLPELLGAKQILYEMQGLRPPSYYKSRELNHLYSSLRHPSFICLTLVLWGSNFMSLDRVVLAALWTLYMMTAWNPSVSDYEYQMNQLNQKRRELRRL